MTGDGPDSRFAPVPTPPTPTGSQPSVRRRRPARGRVWPVLLGWASYAVALAFVGTGWWLGKPLTPELLAVLAAFLGFQARTDGVMWRRLKGHDSAVQAIAEHRGISPDRVASVYDVVDEEIAREQAEERKRPPARPTTRRTQR